MHNWLELFHWKPTGIFKKVIKSISPFRGFFIAPSFEF